MSVKRGETKRRKHLVPWRVVWSYNISREGWVVWQRGIRQHLFTRPFGLFWKHLYFIWDVRVCSIYSNTMKWPLRDTERGRQWLMTPTAANYLHQSSNSSGSWVEERMNIEVYQSKCGRAWETTLFHVIAKSWVGNTYIAIYWKGREHRICYH